MRLAHIQARLSEDPAEVDEYVVSRSANTVSLDLEIKEKFRLMECHIGSNLRHACNEAVMMMMMMMMMMLLFVVVVVVANWTFRNQREREGRS